MPTTVTSKIGATNIPVTMDYSTLQAWEDACPANLVTDDKIWRGEVYNQGELSGLTTISGMTTDSTRYPELTTAAGASFKDHANKLTNALKYDSTLGACVKSSTNYSGTLTISASNVRVSNLQIRQYAGAGSSAVVTNGGATGVTVSDCILQMESNFSAAYNCVSIDRNTLKNCLCIVTVVNPSGIRVFYTGNIYGCTIVKCSNVSGTGVGIIAGYGTAVVKNTAVFGFLSDTTGTITATTNATDDTTPSTGFTGSLTFTSQFEGTTSSAPDFRVKSTSSLKNGTRDTTNTPTDILGRYRSGISPTIGCWEYIAAALPVPGGGSYYWYDGRVVISLQKGTQLTGGEKYWYDGCVVLELSTPAFVPSTLSQKPIIVQQSVNRSNTY